MPTLQRIPTNGIELNVATAGADDAPLVLLLHGFPEFWYGWRRQIEPLAAEGWRVWAPDQRGYNLSDKPQGVCSYALDALVDDVVGLVEAAGAERALVVGHDWGGVVAWQLARCRPDRVAGLVVANAPHPTVMGRALRGEPDQILRSWYTLFFQIPGLPEATLAAGDYRLLQRSLRRSSRPGTFGDDELDRYVEAWGREGAVRSMVDWYRAARRCPRRRCASRVEPPARILWGSRDRFLKPALAKRSLEFCERGELREFPHASHWLQHEQAQDVTRAIAGFARELGGW